MYQTLGRKTKNARILQFRRYHHQMRAFQNHDFNWEKASWQLLEGRKTTLRVHSQALLRLLKSKNGLPTHIKEDFFLLNLSLNHEKRPLEFSLSKNYFRKISFILHGSWPATQRWSFLKLGALDILFCQITTFIKVRMTFVFGLQTF